MPTAGHIGLVRRRVLVAACAAFAACTSAPPAPAPAPRPAPPATPTPTDVERAAAARADSLRLARARADSARAARTTAMPPAPPPPPGRYAGVPRPLARNDTIAKRVLRAPVRVCAGGDVTLGTNLDTAWAHMATERMRARYHRDDAPSSLLAPLRPLVRGADVILVNVESAIGDGAAPSKCGPGSTNCFAFRSPPASAAALRALAPTKVVVANVANNHAHDAGQPGHDTTVALLARAGVAVTGDDTLATPIALPTGDTLGVLGFYTSRETPDARDTAAVRRLVAQAADHYPVVLVTMHLGAEGRGAQNTRDMGERYLGIDRGNPVAFADAAVRGGAALVIGHGPHVLRAMEWRERGALIAYSLGNLLTYGPFVLKEPLNRSALLCATVARTGRVSSALLVPTMQRTAGLLERDGSRRAATLADSLGRVDFPRTSARVDARGSLRPRARR